MDGGNNDEKMYDAILHMFGIQLKQCGLSKKYLVYKLFETLEIKDLWDQFEEAQKKKFNLKDHDDVWKKIYENQQLIDTQNSKNLTPAKLIDEQNVLQSHPQQIIRRKKKIDQ